MYAVCKLLHSTEHIQNSAYFVFAYNKQANIYFKANTHWLHFVEFRITGVQVNFASIKAILFSLSKWWVNPEKIQRKLRICFYWMIWWFNMNLVQSNTHWVISTITCCCCCINLSKNKAYFFVSLFVACKFGHRSVFIN